MEVYPRFPGLELVFSAGLRSGPASPVEADIAYTVVALLKRGERAHAGCPLGYARRPRTHRELHIIHRSWKRGLPLLPRKSQTSLTDEPRMHAAYLAPLTQVSQPNLVITG